MSGHANVASEGLIRVAVVIDGQQVGSGSKLAPFDRPRGQDFMVVVDDVDRLAADGALIKEVH